MSRALNLPPPGFEDLSVEEQIDYVQALWDVIAARPDKVPIPDWHGEILDERIAEAERHPEEGVSWDEFRSQLLTDTDQKRR